MIPTPRNQIPVMYQPTVARNSLGVRAEATGIERTVDPNELASTHVTNLTRPGANNRYLENLRSGARQGYAARGGLNTSLAAAGAEEAGLRGAGELAAQDAAAYRSAAGQNFEASMQADIENRRNQAAMAASIAQGMHSYIGQQSTLAERERDRQFQREEAEREREWRTGESRADRDWRTTEGREGRQWQREENQTQRDYDWNSQEAQTRSAFLFRAIDTMFQSEDFWRDPQAAQGFMNFWAEEAPGLFRGVFNRPRGG